MASTTTVSTGQDVPQNVIDILAGFRAPIFISHVVPDADALGSIFAMALAYSDESHAAKVSLPAGCLSQRLTFMFDWVKVTVATPEDFLAADGFIALDTAKKPRCNVGPALKDSDWSSGKMVVNIDHHDTNTRFGDVIWIDPDASSTAEMVYRLLDGAGRTVTPTIASLLYAGILTDTCGFELPTTSTACLQVAAELVRHGADVAQLGERLCRSLTSSEFDLLRTVYANTKIVADGEIAYSTAGYDDIIGAGCTAADIDDQVAVPRSLQGVRLSFLLTEGNKGKTRINFRGEGNVEVLELAKRFNGGGHRQAAGAVVDGSVEETLPAILKAAIEHIKKFP